MIYTHVNINFELLGQAFKKYVRDKAKASHGTIVYKKGNQLIEEDPQTSQTKILKEYIYSTK